jgi:hypothetical protein
MRRPIVQRIAELHAKLADVDEHVTA